MRTFLSIALAALFILTACDVVEPPYTERPPEPEDTTTVKRNVILEDYTGHTCGNCPRAAKVAHDLEVAYGDSRVIVVAVHAGGFAVPAPPTYPDDFRTPAGDELDQSFRISLQGNPNGMVSRVQVGGKYVLSEGKWGAAVSSLLSTKPVVDLGVTRTFDTNTRELVLNADVRYIKAGKSNYRIVALITESGIIGDQIDYDKTPSHVEDYEFEHVMRTSINGTWGDQISTTDPAAESVIKKEIRYTVPSEWNARNCRVVVYVHDYNASKNILQAVALPLVP